MNGSGAGAGTDRLLVIGCGNALAADDGLGIDLAAVLRRRGDLDVIDADRPGAGLLEFLAGRRSVVFADSVCSGQAPGSVLLCRLPSTRIRPRALAPMSGHGWGIDQVLALGAALHRDLPPTMALIGIEIDAARPGTQRSAAGAAAVAFVASHFDDLVPKALGLDPDDVLVIEPCSARA